MTSLLRKFLPSPSPKNRDDGDDYSVEYSFAVEYSGPPVSHDIPLVVPIDIDRIPTASVVVTASMLSNLSLPVVQPFSKSNLLSNKLSKELKSGSKANISTNSASHSGEFVELSDELGLIDVEEGIPKVSDGIDSSGTLGFSDSRDDSQELSGSSEVEEDLRDDGEVGLDLDEGESCSRALSPEIHSIEGEEDCTSVVTAGDPESSDVGRELTDHYDPEIFRRRASVKKGLCNRCNKRNQFTEKVVCIVCGAQYCGNCAVRAMGSMPEGRKCIPCIGFPIDESKRGSLGKSSRMLRQLLSDSEVKEVMRFEISCKANQLPPRLMHVNGKPLCHEELVVLQTCQNPPKKLKPGRYWYDKVSGFWGKEGEKPCQIISAQLNVGGQISLEASNGDTNILINNRKITKAEFRMLRLAGIQCEGAPHFWVSADGSYQEEGQNNVKGKIWDKPGIKLVCALLSLPTPPKDTNPSGEEVANPANGVLSNFIQQKTLNKLLLVGCDKSGTSTIFKQAKMVYNVPFSEDERQSIKLQIQSSLYCYLGILLEGRERFEEEWLTEMRRKRSDEPGPSRSCGHINEENIYSINQRLKGFSDWLLEVVISGNLDIIFPAASREYAPLIEDIWKDKAFQATYDRRNELRMLPRIANYFLDRAVEISSTDYDPSDTDILYAEGITPSNSLASMEFSFPKSTQDSFMDTADQNDPLHRFQLIRVHASSLGENCKWLEMFEDTDLVLYCVSLTDYDQFSDNSNGVSSNKMLESKRLFESIVTHPTFRRKNFLLILNKFDLLEEKIEQIPLTQCEWFPDFNPVISHNHSSTGSNYSNPSLAQRAFNYIAVKFKKLFVSLTGGRKLYVSRVTGLEPDCVDEALRYTREILKWEKEKPQLTLHESSSCSVDASSSS
ncbi:extra-large guanine nucleotide-binding protein 1-like [Rhododendron vialii]|uniref:extra-large guanine nucleotide-binding protein 1-like n=1 Tax=Rhododendron vialii TaxID=182163 RepID=UPI00265DA0A7|nr:extra-large guanine nucleotide-binding protein 1-like [Rhododendron vialii]XP_058191006.1 extra-large guanine nucleotide-binding protein 1-like [Rhododendron vialii]